MNPATPWQAIVALLAGRVLDADVATSPERWRWATAYLESDPHPPVGTRLDVYVDWVARIPETWREAAIREAMRPQSADNRPAPAEALLLAGPPRRGAR